jgi:hypothetical protein
MKVKTQPRIVDPTNTVSTDILKQLQAVVDDVRAIGKGGLSFSDAQLPFQYREVNVISGVPTILSIQAPFSILGCIPIQTFGNKITSFQSNIVNNKFNVTIELDISSSLIGFLLVGS